MVSSFVNASKYQINMIFCLALNETTLPENALNRIPQSSKWSGNYNLAAMQIDRCKRDCWTREREEECVCVREREIERKWSHLQWSNCSSWKLIYPLHHVGYPPYGGFKHENISRILHIIKMICTPGLQYYIQYDQS